MNIVKDPNRHIHAEVFDTEDQAFAFIHGMHAALHREYIQTSCCYQDGDAEAFCEGFNMGLIHFGRVSEDITIDVFDKPGFTVRFEVDALKQEVQI